jgi:hypothetical protein
MSSKKSSDIVCPVVDVKVEIRLPGHKEPIKLDWGDALKLLDQLEQYLGRGKGGYWYPYTVPCTAPWSNPPYTIYGSYGSCTTNANSNGITLTGC